jgi:hypothetical protein
MAPQVGFEPRKSLRPQKTPTQPTLSWTQLSRRSVRTSLPSVGTRKATVEGQSSALHQRADAQDVALCCLADSRRRSRDDGDRLAIAGEHFELVAFGHIATCGIVFDDLTSLDEHHQQNGALSEHSPLPQGSSVKEKQRIATPAEEHED